MDSCKEDQNENSMSNPITTGVQEWTIRQPNPAEIYIMQGSEVVALLDDNSKAIRIKTAHNAALAPGREKHLSPCDKIFDHEWLDPVCVNDGCQSLKIQQLREQLQIEIAHNEGLTGDVKQLREQLAAEQRRAVHVGEGQRAAVDDLNLQLAATKDEVRIMTTQCVQLRQELESEREKLRQANASYPSLKTEIQQLRKQLAAVDQALKAELKNSTKLFRKLDESQYQLAAAQVAIKAHKDLACCDSYEMFDNSNTALDAALAEAYAKGAQHQHKEDMFSQQPLVDALKQIKAYPSLSYRECCEIIDASLSKVVKK